MRQQHLGGHDDYQDSPELMGEERYDEYERPQRRWPKGVLTIGAMAVFAGGLYVAYVQGTKHPAAMPTADGVPLIRADERPTKVKPDQPGGMAIPDQNVSLYNEKPGGPPVEKLLPAAEQPMPRPVPAPREAAIPASPPGPPQAILQGTPSASPLDGVPSQPAHVAPKPAAKAATAAPQPKQAAVQPATVPAGKGAIQLRLGSVRSPEAARDEWARLKRENSDLLGKLTAVAVRADLGEQGIYYRIQAGSFGDPAAAEKLCGELKRRKLGCILAR